MRTRQSRHGTFDRPFVAAASWLLARGVHPNHFTFAQVPFFAIEVWAAVEGYRWIFVSTIIAIIALDGGDGILARVGNLQSRQGAILDATFDTLGIAIVMWGAAQFFPSYETWFLALFLGNGLLYLQNALLEEKMVSYLRGPTIIAIAWPDFIAGAVLLSTFIVAWIFVMRLRRTWRALPSMELS